MTPKQELRRAVLARRDALPRSELAARSALASERLLSLQELAAARLVMFFVSFGSEIDTVPMIARALAHGKRVAAPQVEAGARILVPREIRSLEHDLAEAAYGIRAPTADRPPIPLDEIEVVIVPAAVWDEEGFRVGYGGGYYDRFLPRVPHACWLGLGLELQVAPAVPRGPHDLPVDALVTDAQTRRFPGRERAVGTGAAPSA